MITKWFEITCDYCGHRVHYMANGESTTELALKGGFFTTGNGKHYCCRECKFLAKEARDE